ncbi:MAG: hypothetical protein NC095_12245 [Muribaculum sp.]|nr:hypothetical protein [Muribaculum sp.]
MKRLIMLKRLYLTILLPMLLCLQVEGQNKDYEFYIQPGYNTATSGVVLGLGGFMKGFNLEGNLMAGVSTSEKIYWNDLDGESMPYAATYRPIGGNIKIGYGIGIGERIRITPQIGLQYITLKEKGDSEFTTGEYSDLPQLYHEAADGSHSIGASVGARFSIYLFSHIGLSVTPEYTKGVKQSDGFKALSEVSSKIKKYGEGFGCNINLTISF